MASINDFNPSWIKEVIDEFCIEYMDWFGKYLCDKKEDSLFPGYNAMTTSQIRNVFGELKRLEGFLAVKTKDQRAEEWKNIRTKFLLLKPKIAYNTARVIEKRRDSKIKDFRQVFEKAYNAVVELKENPEKEADAFLRLCQFMEGVISYHKVHGGRSN